MAGMFRQPRRLRPAQLRLGRRNRLAGIGYNVTGHQTAFAYDRRGQQAVIAETTGSSTTTTTCRVWCGRRLCRSLDANGAVVRQYYPEGELIAASNTAFYYGPDQLGTARRLRGEPLFQVAQAYDYDPYGNPIAAPATGPFPDSAMPGCISAARAGSR